MKLIEAGKVKQVMKDYWKAQVNKALTLTADVNEADKRINIYLEHNHELLKLIDELPTAQPERTCVNCGRTANNGGWYADGGTRCPIEEHYALPKDGYCHLWEKRNVTDDDYPERRPSIQPDTTTHDSIPAETGKNDGDRTSGDCISRQRSIDTLRKMQTYKLFAGDDMLLIDQAEAQTELMMLPSAQPERKDALKKAVAVEAICDELMSRFDVSATYGYDFAEAVMNRIEAMAKELEGGKQE